MHDQQTSESQRVVLITGGRGRIGTRLAQALVQRGDIVISVDRTPFSQSKGDKKRTTSQGQVFNFKANLASEKGANVVFESIFSQFQRIDAAVLSAGDFTYGTFADASPVDFERMFKNNAMTAFCTLKHLIPRMKKVGGHIVIMGSLADHRILRGNSCYAPAKAALRMLVEVLREEVNETQIRFTHLCFGAIASPMAMKLGKADANSLLSPATVVETICWAIDRPIDARFDELKILPPIGVLNP